MVPWWKVCAGATCDRNAGTTLDDYDMYMTYGEAVDVVLTTGDWSTSYGIAGTNRRFDLLKPG